MIIFDVVVPTYRRYADLPRFFLENSTLNRSEVKIWLVDDASPAVDRSVIPNWSNIDFTVLETNGGQAHARNVAILKGQAPFIISLDDDAWIEGGYAALSLVPKFFIDHPDTGCAMFNIATPGSPYSNIISGSELALHVTCGCAYRRDALMAVGNFSDFLHSGAEETDLSLRLCRAKWKVRFFGDVKVFHNFVPRSRPIEWYYDVRYKTTRNDLLVVLMYYPGVVVPLFLAGKVISHLRYAITAGASVPKTLWITMKAVAGFLGMSGRALERRAPLGWTQFRKWRKLNFSTNET